MKIHRLNYSEFERALQRLSILSWDITVGCQMQKNIFIPISQKIEVGKWFFSIDEGVNNTL